jgi:hypothetical protein
METGAAAERRGPLRGRAGERGLLYGLIADVRPCEGRSLVSRGEAGIRKRALLEHLIGLASDMTVLRAVGVESETELPGVSGRDRALTSPTDGASRKACVCP